MRMEGNGRTSDTLRIVHRGSGMIFQKLCENYVFDPERTLPGQLNESLIEFDYLHEVDALIGALEMFKAKMQSQIGRWEWLH